MLYTETDITASIRSTGFTAWDSIPAPAASYPWTHDEARAGTDLPN